MRVDAKDYASATATFFGDRPLDNPGYSKMELTGEVKVGSINKLDVLKVEQRLKYLGYGLASTGVAGTGEVTVDGSFDQKEAADLKLFEKVVRYNSATGSGQGTSAGVLVEIQYRASVQASPDTAKLEEVVGSFKIVTVPANLTGAALTTAINNAKNLAIADAKPKPKALSAAGFTSATDINGMDGQIEGDAASMQRIKTLGWLNAYNAPHWMQFIDIFTQGTRLPQWENKLTANAIGGGGTSWIYDLMVASQTAASTQNPARATPMWFKGTGELGVKLNLGINTAYISQNNQDRQGGKDKILGVIPAQADANNPLPNAAAYNAKQWSLANANALAAKLRNPTVSTTRTGSANDNGENQQDQVMLDFLRVFATTQASGADAANPNGYWNGIAITNANADVIRKALFGDGTTESGLIDSQNILIGGTAAPLGARMTAESLGRYMGNVAGVNYAAWLEPLQKTMVEFDINTPQRIAAFLAQINQESGGMSSLRENFNYTRTGLHDTFSLLRAIAPGQTIIYAQLYGRPDETRAGTGSDVPLATQELIANVAYNGRIGNIAGSGDGWLFRGHGLKQITFRSNTQAFADYIDRLANFVPGQPTGAMIMATPDLLASNLYLAA